MYKAIYKDTKSITKQENILMKDSLNLQSGGDNRQKVCIIVTALSKLHKLCITASKENNSSKQ